MIIDIPDKRQDGKSCFFRLCDYISGGVEGEEKTIYTNTMNLESDGRKLSAEEAAREMHYNAHLNKRIKDPIYHAVMSFREGEVPTAEQADEAVRIYLEELGMGHCHAYYGLHANTKNMHIHVCVSRVDPDTQLAVTPANGFTYKANERAARRIELAQGWEVERSGHLCGVVDGQVVDCADKRDKAICGRAKDFENYAAEKSAIRIAKEELSGLLFDENITAWSELHVRLADKGARLEKKGSGAVLVLGGVPIKLSSVSQKLSMAKLTKRLGAFEAAEDMEIKELPPKPMRNTSGITEYVQQRHEFYREKRTVEEELEKRRQEARKLLIEKQKKEIKGLYGIRGTWKGKGAQLNALRSELALKHVKEKQTFREYYKQERKKAAYRFPSYKEWEKERGNERIAELWRYRASIAGVLSGDKFVTPRQSRTVFSYGTSYDGQMKALRYFKGYKVAFTDKGKRIDVHEWEDEKILKDVLMLAQEKWGGVTLHGSEQYIEKCLTVAAKNEINVRNPELKERMRKLKEAKRRSYQNYLRQCEKAGNVAVFATYCDAVGAERYRITVEGGIGDDNYARYVIGGREGAEGLSPEEAVGKWEEIVKRKDARKNVYVTPISQKTNHIVVDGLSAASLAALKKDEYQPAVVIMNADDDYSVVINAPKLGVGSAAKEAFKELKEEIRNKYTGSLRDSEKHLLPCFSNFEESVGKEDCLSARVRLIEFNGGICGRTAEDEKRILSGIAMRDKVAQRVKNDVPIMAQRAASRSPYDAYMVHAKDIIENIGGVNNWNRLDCMVAVRMKITGFDREAIEKAIEKGGFDIRPENERKKLFSGHAKRMAEYVESVAGQKAVNRCLGCKYKWLKLEGRAFGKEMKGIGL